jgi:hypothetical protein
MDVCQIEPGDECLRRLGSNDRRHRVKGARRQPGNEEQRDARRHLEYDQDASEPALTSSSGGLVLQPCRYDVARSEPGWSNSTQGNHGGDEDEHENQYPMIDREGRRKERLERLEEQSGASPADGTRDDCQQHDLDGEQFRELGS